MAIKIKYVGRRKKTSESGSSLIEVLVALVIMMILMIGILQMFSVAYMENMGAAALTEMTYKAQQFAETIRYLHFLSLNAAATPPMALPSNTGINFPLSATVGVVLIDPSANTYWNENGADIVSIASPYSVGYQIADPGGTDWVVTVIVTPKVTGSQYLGMGVRNKVILYTAQIPKP